MTAIEKILKIFQDKKRVYSETNLIRKSWVSYVRAIWTLAVCAAGGIGGKSRSLAALVTQPAWATTECIHLGRYNFGC